MRYLTSSMLAIGLVCSQPVIAQSSDSLNYNIVNLQADATRRISNDQMHAVLFIEKNHKNPAELATEITQLMNQALNTSRQFPSVKVETGSQSTSPIYDADNRKLKEWRGRAQIEIHSDDFRAVSQLIAELQQNFQTQSINFSVSDTKRQKVENELIVEATKNFQQRAKTLAAAWNKSNYSLVNININTHNYSSQPMPRLTMMKATMADTVPEQEIAAGESSLNVVVNGSIQFK